jgi:hypothetical protein
MTGSTGSTDFPVLNQYQSDPGDSNDDVFVTKLDTTKSGTASLLYSTYLGGGDNDHGHSIAIDNSGYAYVTGSTGSSDFPILNQYQGDQTGTDAFVTKLIDDFPDDFPWVLFMPAIMGLKQATK